MKRRTPEQGSVAGGADGGEAVATAVDLGLQGREPQRYRLWVGRRHRPTWWRRIEARVVLVLTLLAVVTFLAAQRFVSLSAETFDRVAFEQQQDALAALDHSVPLYEGLVSAKLESFNARADHLVLQLVGYSASATQAQNVDNLVTTTLETDSDLALVVIRRDQIVLFTHKSEPSLEESAVAPRVRLERVVDAQARSLVESSAAATASEWDGVTVELEFRVDAVWNRRFQAIGAARRKLDLVAFDDRGPIAHQELSRAVQRAVGVGLAIFSLIVVLLGWLLARRATRKVTDVAHVMRRIAAGDATARASDVGQDEIGMLARDLNGMLAELEAARTRVGYLQKIAAWQDMARRIAHEIKNPLTPIQLAVEQLVEKAPRDDPKYARLVAESSEIVHDEIAVLRRMVNSFSRFARMPEVALERVDARHLLEDFAKTYASSLRAETSSGVAAVDALDLDQVEVEVALEVTVPDAETWISADRQLLKQVLLNLVENAIHSVTEAKVPAPTVRVSTIVTRKELQILVDDNGPGIEPERRIVIFEPYETSRPRGTGLGLAIVKKVLLDHGGEVRVEEGPLGGARFVLTLPRA